MKEQEKASTPTQMENSFVERLANRLGTAANAKNIYGDPVERDGVTVIPVAKAAYGFGGGSGKNEKEEGAGGGGGISLTPVGYIEIKNGETRFHPIRNPLMYAALAAPVVLFAVWQFTKVFRQNMDGN